MKISNRVVQGLDSILETLLRSGHSAPHGAVAGTAAKGGKQIHAQSGGQYYTYTVYSKKTGW